MRLAIGRAFAEVFETGEHDLSQEAVAELFGELGGPAHSRGVLTGPHERSVIACQWCETAGHDIEVRWNSDANCYEGYCAEAGRVSVDQNQVLAYRFMPDVFLEWLGEAACVSGKPNVTADGALYLIGEAKLGAMYWRLYAARGLNIASRRHAVLERLRHGSGKLPGLVLVAEPSGIPEAYMNRYTFARFEDVFDLRVGRPELNEEYVRHRLAGRDGSPKVKSKDISFEIFNACLDENGQLPNGKALEKYVQSRWPNDRDPIERTQIYEYRKAFLKRSSGRPESDAKPD